MTTNLRKRTAETQEEAWVADEDRFVLAQAKKKAVLRVRAGRGRPIDLLAVALRAIEPADGGLGEEEEEEDEALLVDPEVVFDGLQASELADLEKEVETYLALERSRVGHEYWKALKVVCRDRRRETDRGANDSTSSVATSLDKILEPKDIGQLEALEKQVRQKLRGQESIDVDYWENLLKRLSVHKARAQLRRIARQVVDSRVKRLRGEQIREARAFASRIAARTTLTACNPDHTDMTALDPQPSLKVDKNDRGLGMVEQREFDEVVRKEKQRVTKAGYIAERKLVPALGGSAATDNDHGPSRSSAYDREVARGLDEDEEVLTTEESMVETRRPAWADQYVPRKPRYFNRVQLGYEWNKYNQTHYDQDKPPPKVVQGYKFNVFYPDLIDPTKAPTYRIEREGGRKRGQTLAPAGEEDTCLIRFIAGAPYHDLTFRIVDREWDYSAKRERGFRSSFDKGILQLHFQFKKVYYRK